MYIMVVASNSVDYAHNHVSLAGVRLTTSEDAHIINITVVSRKIYCLQSGIHIANFV